MLVLIVVLLRPLVVAWGLHGGGYIRGGLIACWSGRGAMMMRASERALSRELSTGGEVDVDGGGSEDGDVSQRREQGGRERAVVVVGVKGAFVGVKSLSLSRTATKNVVPELAGLEEEQANA
jgi:hypothetical protein